MSPAVRSFVIQTMLTADVDQSPLKRWQKLPKKLIERVLHEVSHALHLKDPQHLSIAFVSEKKIRELNRVYRKKNEVTDVLAFPLVEPECQGEVVLCYNKAKAQARRMKHSTRDEVIFLLVHGILHVFGYDHERSNDAKKMFFLQTAIVKRLDIDPSL